MSLIFGAFTEMEQVFQRKGTIVHVRDMRFTVLPLLVLLFSRADDER